MGDINSDHEAHHLCVLVHGLWGNPNHLAFMAKSLREKHPQETLHILVAKRNSGNFTYDGIELGGERVCQEIEEEIENVAKQGNTITRLSLIGYSLGGLVARYAVGLLESKGMFDRITPVNFSTFATPHLGVRSPLRGWHNQLFNILGARTLSASGRQLFTIDQFRGTGRPLLEVLADPGSIFIQGLTKFQRRTLYANITNDRSAVYYTTAISKTDPYTDLDKIKINYAKGFNDIILDSRRPVAPLFPEVSRTLYGTVLETSKTTFGRLPLFVALGFVVPLAVVAFLINAGIQSLRSTRRIKLHERGLAGIKPSDYRVPLLITEMRGAVEDAYENLNSAQGNEYLVAGTEEEAAQEEPSSSTLDQPSNSSANASTTALKRQTSEKSDPHSHEQPTLALAPYQFRMIQALDNVGWRKFYVHIHKVRHSHAAIIVRVEKPSFDEGRVVINHWLDEEFIP